MASRPSLSLNRKSPLKSKKAAGGSSGGAGGKKGATSAGTSTPHSRKQPWVDTVNDLEIYKPSKEAIEAKKIQRKSKNLPLAKVSIIDKRALQDPESQRLLQQHIMMNYHKVQPSQNVEAILARSEQVMGICQGILNGEMISASAPPLLVPVAAAAPPSPTERLQQSGGEEEDGEMVGGNGGPPPYYMNSAALSEIAGELLVTVRELREELIQEREAREKLEREVIQQRELLVELCREVVRLQLHCATDNLQQTRIV